MLFSRADVLDPGIHQIAARHAPAFTEIELDETGWTFKCGAKIHRILETETWELLQHEDYDGITALVLAACKAVS